MRAFPPSLSCAGRVVAILLRAVSACPSLRLGLNSASILSLNTRLFIKCAGGYNFVAMAHYVVSQPAVEEELPGFESASGKQYTRDKGHGGMTLRGISQMRDAMIQVEVSFMH